MFERAMKKLKGMFRSELASPGHTQPVGYMNRKQRRVALSLARKRAVEPRRRKYEKRGVKR